MDLKDVLKKAIQGEIEGRELYKAAAEKSEDEKAKEVFAFLAEEEDAHISALQSIFKSYIDNKESKILAWKQKQYELPRSKLLGIIPRRD